MGYRSEVAFCLHKNGRNVLNDMLEKTNSTTQELVKKFLNLSDTHITDTQTGSEIWFWEFVKWYPEEYAEIGFMERLMSTLEVKNFMFIRIGDDEDDTELRGYYTNNPFDMYLNRNIVFKNSEV